MPGAGAGWLVHEKAALVRHTYEMAMAVTLMARQEGVAAKRSL